MRAVPMGLGAKTKERRRLRVFVVPFWKAIWPAEICVRQWRVDLTLLVREVISSSRLSWRRPSLRPFWRHPFSLLSFHLS
jgi:hypothetical protein